MRKIIAGLLRVLGISTLMLTLVVGFSIRRADAQLKETILGFGRQLAGIQAFSSPAAPRSLYVNGLEIKTVTVATKLGVKDALDRFQGLCHSPGQVDLPKEVTHKLQGTETGSTLNQAGVVRRETNIDGYLGCVDLGEKLTGAGLVSRLLELGKTQNLRSLGQLRYAMVQRTADTTTLKVLWTEGDMKFNELFPKTGDAPGRDLPSLPRPPDSQRILSTEVVGLPFGIASYRVEGKTRATVLESYRTLLSNQGWKLGNMRNRVFQAERAGRRVLVSVTEPRARRLMVTVSDLG